MMSYSGCQTKKELKLRVGHSPRFIETSFFGLEYDGKDGRYTIVGPSPYNRKWYATVTVKNGIIVKVS